MIKRAISTTMSSAMIVVVITVVFATPAMSQSYTLRGSVSSPVSAQFASSAPVQFVAASPSSETNATGSDTLRTPESYHKHPFLLTTFDLILLNEVQWAANMIMREDNTEFRVGWNSLKENIKNGFEWDDNNFSTNHFVHPYQGSLTFTAARANGYDFYEAIPFTFMGSLMWEYWGEANHGAINDWVITGFGGMALGESLMRLSDMVLDNTATGSERAWRELGGFFMAPARGFNRMVTGEAFEVHANPKNRFPAHGGGKFRIGLRALGDERLWNSSGTKAFIRFDANYGDPFLDPMNKPFDHFDFTFQFNFNDSPYSIGRIEATGILYGADVHKTENTHFKLAAYQHFDYIENEAFSFGNQAFSASHLGRIETANGFRATTEMHANVILLGASRTDYFSVSGREYDYGPGFGYKLAVEFGKADREILRLSHDSYYIHTMNGTDSDHFLSVSQLTVNFPIRAYLNFSTEYVLYLAERKYANFDDVSARNPEIRAYIWWGDGQ